MAMINGVQATNLGAGLSAAGQGMQQELMWANRFGGNQDTQLLKEQMRETYGRQIEELKLQALGQARGRGVRGGGGGGGSGMTDQEIQDNAARQGWNAYLATKPDTPMSLKAWRVQHQNEEDGVPTMTTQPDAYPESPGEMSYGSTATKQAPAQPLPAVSHKAYADALVAGQAGGAQAEAMQKSMSQGLINSQQQGIANAGAGTEAGDTAAQNILGMEGKDQYKQNANGTVNVVTGDTDATDVSQQKADAATANAEANMKRAGKPAAGRGGGATTKQDTAALTSLQKEESDMARAVQNAQRNVAMAVGTRDKANAQVQLDQAQAAYNAKQREVAAARARLQSGPTGAPSGANPLGKTPSLKDFDR